MTGRRPALAVAAEALRATRAATVPSTILLLIAAAVCGTVLLTAGRSAAAEQSLANQLDSAGARVIQITDGSGSGGLTARAVERISRLSGISFAVGLGNAVDVRIASLQGGTLVSARPIYGPENPDIAILTGRWPGPGEAVVTPAAAGQLGLTSAAGTVRRYGAEGADIPVVGTFQATGALTDINSSILIGPTDCDAPLPHLIVLTNRAADVMELAAVLADATGADDPTGLKVTTSDVLLAMRHVVSGEFGQYSRQVAAVTLLSGVILMGITCIGSVNARRRDFGRRRALGASRSAITGIVVIQSTLPALVGAVIGGGAGIVINRFTVGVIPPLSYPIASAALVMVAAGLASVPAALATAWRDPVRELRVP